MNKLMLSALALVLANGAAFAGCDAGNDLVTDAVLASARAGHYQGCRKVLVDEPAQLGGSDEAYVARVACKRQSLVCHVVLHEIEDAYCEVKSTACGPETTFSHGPARPHPRPVTPKCPPPGTVINCFPPASDPLCQLPRATAKRQCPGLKWLD